MYGSNPTAELALPYGEIPRIDETYVVTADSHIDLFLPVNTLGADRERLRLYDFHENYVRAVDLSGFYRIPEREDADFLAAPQVAYDDFSMSDEFYIGRNHNPGDLPILNKNVISRRQVGLTLEIGHLGLLLTVRDTFSHNGTEVIPSPDTKTLQREELRSSL